MALTDKQRAARKGKLTASAVACLMDGDQERVYSLWQELVDDPDFVPPDFSDNWHVALGNATEQLNLDWFAKKRGPVTARGVVRVHPDHDWAACTLDGWSVDDDCPIECKHLIGFTPTNEASVKYYAQMQWQMWVTDTDNCAFSAIQGGRPPEVILVPRDEEYIKEMVARAASFMTCVETLTPPVAAPQMVGVVPEGGFTKEYDMRATCEQYGIWEGAAAIWATNKPRVKLFNDTEAVLKKMMPADAKRAFGAGIEITRAKNGACTIKELKADGEENRSRRKRA